MAVSRDNMECLHRKSVCDLPAFSIDSQVSCFSLEPPSLFLNRSSQSLPIAHPGRRKMPDGLQEVSAKAFEEAEIEIGQRELDGSGSIQIIGVGFAYSWLGRI